jgi:hypothetical protein
MFNIYASKVTSKYIYVSLIKLLKIRVIGDGERLLPYQVFKAHYKTVLLSEGNDQWNKREY